MKTVLAPPTRETARLYANTPLGRAHASYRPSSPSRWAAAVAANIGGWRLAGRAARASPTTGQYQALYRHRFVPLAVAMIASVRSPGKFRSPGCADSWRCRHGR